MVVVSWGAAMTTEIASGAPLRATIRDAIRQSLLQFARAGFNNFVGGVLLVIAYASVTAVASLFPKSEMPLRDIALGGDLVSWLATQLVSLGKWLVELGQSLPPGPTGLGRFLLNDAGCDVDGSACAPKWLLSILVLVEVVQFLAATVVAGFVFWLARIVFVESRAFEDRNALQPKIPVVTANAILIGGAGIIGLAMWASKGQREIPYEIGSAALVGFALALAIAGWIPVARREIPSWPVMGPVLLRISLATRRALAVTAFLPETIGRLVNGFDYFLVRRVAKWAGTTLTWQSFVPSVLRTRGDAFEEGDDRGSWFPRYGALVLWYGFFCWLIVHARTPFCWWAAGAACLFTLSVIRRWSWIEEDRALWMEGNDIERKSTRLRIRFRQDLTDEAMTLLAVLILVVMPLLLERANREQISFGCMAQAEWNRQHGMPDVRTESITCKAEDRKHLDPAAFGGDYSPVVWVATAARSIASWLKENAQDTAEWVGFIGGELTKAMPFVDWSEVYGVKNGAIFDLSTGDENARNMVFAIRVSMDLLLLTAFLQAISSIVRLGNLRARFDDPGDDLNILDPFEERAIFNRTASDPEYGKRLAIYDQSALRAAVAATDRYASALGRLGWLDGSWLPK